MLRAFDVIVVGAGPAGCTAAEHLAQAGWHVAVLEEHLQVGSPVNCSGVVGVEAFERFGLPESLIRHTLQSVEFHSPSGARWSFEARQALAHAVGRTALDQLLAQRAARSGAELLLGCRVVDLEWTDRDVRVRVAGQREGVLHGRAAVLATGAGVPLLKKLGFGRIPQRLLGVQTELELDAARVEIYLGRRWAPEGFAWLVPLGGRVVKAGLLSHRDGPFYLRQFLDRKDIRGRIHGEPGPIRCSILPLGFLPRSYRDRVLVVGEAAGHIKATTCGGIYYGMLTASLAAETLHDALRSGRLDARYLSRYEKRWRRLLQDEIEIGLKLRRAFHRVGDVALDHLISLARRDGIIRLIHDKANFDWHRDLLRAVFRHATVGRVLGAA